MGLHSAHSPARVALVPGPVEVFRGASELHDEIAGEVLRLCLAPLFAPELDQGCLIAAHDNPSVRAADKGAAVQDWREIRLWLAHYKTPESQPLIRKVSNIMTGKSILKVSIRQVKAARELLAWSQDQLAQKAGVSVPTIKRLEASDGPLGGRADTVNKIRTALENGGVVFIDENGGGPGVRLKQRSRQKGRQTWLMVG